MDINDDEFAELPPEKQLSALFRTVSASPAKTVEAMKAVFLTREEHAALCPMEKKPPTGIPAEPWSFAAIRNAFVVVVLTALFVGVATGYIPVSAVQGFVQPSPIAAPK